MRFLLETISVAYPFLAQIVSPGVEYVNISARLNRGVICRIYDYSTPSVKPIGPIVMVVVAVPVAIVIVTVIVVAVVTSMVISMAVAIIASVISGMPASVTSAFTKGQTGTTHNKNTHNCRDILFHMYLLAKV